MALRYALLLELEGGKEDKGAVSDRLREELLEAICDRAFFVEDERVRDASAFQERVGKAKTRLIDVAKEVCRVVGEILAEYQALRPRMNQQGVPIWQRAMTDIRNQLKELLPPGFLLRRRCRGSEHFPRYLKAIQVRLDKFGINPAKDAQWQQQIAAGGRPIRRAWPPNRSAACMTRSRRISLDAGGAARLALGAAAQDPFPISFKRVERFWSELR